MKREYWMEVFDRWLCKAEPHGQADGTLQRSTKGVQAWAR